MDKFVITKANKNIILTLDFKLEWKGISIFRLNTRKS